MHSCRLHYNTHLLGNVLSSRVDGRRAHTGSYPYDGQLEMHVVPLLLAGVSAGALQFTRSLVSASYQYGLQTCSTVPRYVAEQVLTMQDALGLAAHVLLLHAVMASRTHSAETPGMPHLQWNCKGKQFYWACPVAGMKCLSQW